MILIKNSNRPIWDKTGLLRKAIFPIKSYHVSDVENMVTIKQKVVRIIADLTKRSAFRTG